MQNLVYYFAAVVFTSGMQQIFMYNQYENIHKIRTLIIAYIYYIHRHTAIGSTDFTMRTFAKRPCLETVRIFKKKNFYPPRMQKSIGFFIECFSSDRTRLHREKCPNSTLVVPRAFDHHVLKRDASSRSNGFTETKKK